MKELGKKQVTRVREGRQKVSRFKEERKEGRERKKGSTEPERKEERGNYDRHCEGRNEGIEAQRGRR